MKRIIMFLILSFGVIQIYAQTPVEPEKIVVNVTDLTPSQLEKIKADERLKTITEKIETYGNWVGVGNEVGIAIKEGLNAVVDVSERFGNTKVGEFTMYLIAWKVVGKDFVRIFLGIIFILIISILIFKSFRRMFPRKILFKSNGWKFWLPKEYKLIEPVHYDSMEFVKFLHIIALAGAFGLTYAIMFG